MYYFTNYKIVRSYANIDAILRYLADNSVTGYELRIYASCIIFSGGKRLDISGVIPAEDILKEW